MKFKLASEMKAPWSVFLWVDVVLLVMLSTHRQSVSSAPLTAASSNHGFYEKLYQNATEQSCLMLPKVTKADYNYTSSKINRLCSSSVVAEIVETNPSKNICNSLMTTFPKLCQSYNSSKSNNVTANTPVDLMKAGSAGIKVVCANLEDAVRNISQIVGGGRNIVSPFESQQVSSVDANSNTKDIEKSKCVSLCKNLREDREGFNEYAKLDVHPACLLLLEGFIRYQQIYSQSTSSENPPKSAPGSESTQSSKVVQNGNVAITTRTELDSKMAKSSSGNNEIATQTAKMLQPGKNEPIEDKAGSSTDSNKENAVTLKQEPKEVVMTENKASKNTPKNVGTSQPILEETATNLENLDTKNDKVSKLPEDNFVAPAKNPINERVSSSSTTTTTVASLDARINEEPLPIESGNKMKSSTAIPGIKVDSVTAGLENKKGTNAESKVTSAVGSNLVTENKGKVVSEKSSQDKNQNKPPAKNEDDSNLMAELGEESPPEYDDEDLDNNGAMKPPTKLDGDDKDVGIARPEIYSGGELGNTYKSTKFSGNALREEEDITFSRGTTINVSVKESEDTGFFNYFLFSVTLVGLMYLVVHNKKKLIAFVVEGKRPRSRSRRSSSSSQYRRLENNFD